MNALGLLAIASTLFLCAYFTYGKFLAKVIFKVDPKRVTPSNQYNDGKEFVPSERQVMFGHHFTSIAGTGPIVGPAIGVIWGWVPAVLWIVFGSIFLGAVHDFSTLMVSIRNQGRSIVDIASKYINHRVRMMFFVVVFLALLIVIAIFGLVIALIFAQFPQAVIPVWLEIPIAIALGHFAFSKKGSIKKWTLISVLLMAVTVVIGAYFPIVLPSFLSMPSTGCWTIILLVYAYIASIIRVPVLLQPRDYINAWQLYITLGMIVVSIVVTSFVKGLPIAAPAINLSPIGAPPMMPFLFITIACGAISGFHSLVCSGTSSKQISTEADAQFVGYGAMITEGFLAVVVVIAVTAGIGLSYTASSGDVLTGIQAWQSHYGSWASSAGLGSKLSAVVIGCANMMNTLGISMLFGTAIVGVFIASFAGTTLDSATRVQRYIISEFFQHTKFKQLSNRYIATGIAVVTAALLAFSSGANGKGALVLWPLFGAVNQLLAGLALLVATSYLKSKGGLKYLITAIPCGFIMCVTLWASLENTVVFIKEGNHVLTTVNTIILGLSVLIAIESVASLTKNKVNK